MAIFLYCQSSFGQLTIPAGNTYTSLSYRPLSSYYGYYRTNSHYPAADINIAPGSTITGIRYYVESTSSPSSAVPVKIYMANASGITTFSEIYGNALSGTTLVYNATIPASSFMSGRWIYLPLSTPFVYTGIGLQVLVENNYGSGTGGDLSTSKQFRTSPGDSQTWSSFSTPISSNTYGVPIGNKPNMQIFYNTPGYSGNVSFDNDILTTNEGTMALVTVNRNGGSTGAISVSYSTTNGTATAGLDYTAASGILTWADGDTTPKIINVPILPDFILDNAENFKVTLSDPVGTTITNANPSTVIINDVLPPMNGTYTVGTGGNFPSLTNAGGIFEAINNRVAGISGPLTINIISDLTGETGTIGLNEIAGGHAVLIQPFGGPRTITGALGTTSNLGLIRFDGTDNVTINGSLVGAEAPDCQIGGDASLRQLTIVNNSIGTTAAVLFQSSTTGAYNNTIKNVNLVGASPSIGYGAMFRVFPHSVSVPSLVNNQNSRVVNCSVKKASIGIYSAGSTISNPNTNLVVTGNDISATGADRVSKNAILIANETNPQVTFNKVNIMNTTSDLSETVGLAIGASQAYATSVTSGGISGALVANNWITGVVSTVDLGGSTAGIAISGTAFGTPNVVKNNMISNVSGLSQYTYNVAGIWVVGAVASETKLYHNTISLYGDRGSRTNQSPSYGIAISGQDPSVEMRNNIISTTQIATGGGFVKTYAFGTLSTTFANLISDNNVFYSGGAQDGGFRSGSLSNNAGTSYATLTDWTAATQRDNNSIEVAPVFVAPNDLHLLAGSNPIIEATPGSPIASVTTDIDCNSRSTTNPAIGADEINVTGYSISAGAGTGGAITPAGMTIVAVGSTSVYTITPNCGYMVSDVLVDGVSQGAISTYTFSGVTSSHTITATFSAVSPTITAAGPTTFCIGGSVVLTSSSPTGNLWSTGETTQSITAQASGNYWVSFNNGTCYSPQSAPTTVIITPPATAPTITAVGPLTFCQGGSVTLTSSATTGNLWSNGATTRSITVTSSGNFSVIYNNGGCDSMPSAVTVVTVNPIPDTPTISPSGSVAICSGSSIVLTSSSPTGNIWSTGETTPSITVTSAGNYNVKVSLSSCQSAVSANTVVTVNPIPTRPTITASGATTFCQGGSVTLTSSATTGNTWSNGATTQSITVTDSGIYTVTATNTYGCNSLVSVGRSVTVNPTPDVPTITAGGPIQFCTGGNVVLTSSATTGNTWSNGATTQSITVTSSGVYTVTAKIGTCSSAASAGTTVTVNPIPATPTITAGGATTFCSGGNLTLTSSATTGNTWSNGATTQSITVTDSGVYTVNTTVNGCTSNTSSGTTVTVNATPVTPTITAGGATTFCSGGNLTLTSSAATGNIWSNGATTQSITVTDSGVYTVNATANGCTSNTSSGTTVTVNAIPATPTITAGGATTFCSGGDVTLTSSSATGNVWSTGATTQSITVSTAGDYSVAVTANGCSSPQSTATTVSVNPAPNNEITQSSGVITATQGGATYQWYMCPNTLIDGATSQQYIPLVVGDYKVVVTLGSCTLTSDCINVTELGTNQFDISKFKLYPNPVNNILNIQYTKELNKVTVYNMLGQMLISRDVNTNTVQIDMSGLPSSTYLVQASSENGITTFKVVKN